MSAIPSISPALFATNIQTPVGGKIPISVPLNFAAVANLQIFSNTYIPNNDFSIVFSGISAAQAPNFIIVIVSAPANLNASGVTMTEIPITKFLFMSLVPSATEYLNQLYIDGRLSAPIPMTQGTPVDYTIIIGQATIT